jgi:molybdenum cofactor biosynthesis enzyme MoaA
MISREVVNAIRHGSYDDVLREAYKARDAHLTAVNVVADRRLNAIDVRSMLLTGFAIVQGAVDIMFAVWCHGR